MLARDGSKAFLFFYIKMIIMIMTYNDHINLREVIEEYARRPDSLRSCKFKGAGAIIPNGICKNIPAAPLNKKCFVVTK